MTNADLLRADAGPTRMYVIGNGFDRYHGIPSDFRDFARHLAAADPTVYRMVGEYFSADARFWADFETCFAEFDQNQAVDYATQFLDDEGHGDFQYELEQIATGLSSGLRACFAEWVRGLPIPERGMVARPLDIDPSAVFLSFNYTPTLERVYGIACTRIPPHPRRRHRSRLGTGSGAWMEPCAGEQPQLRSRWAER